MPRALTYQPPLLGAHFVPPERVPEVDCCGHGEHRDRVGRAGPVERGLIALSEVVRRNERTYDFLPLRGHAQRGAGPW